MKLAQVFAFGGIAISLLGLASGSAAMSGHQWVASAVTELSRVLSNMRSAGCSGLRSDDYYYRAVNAMYGESAARSVQVHEAVALIATTVGARC